MIPRFRPSTVTMLPTYRCTAACKQCCFQSNPSIRHRIPQPRLLSYVDQAIEIEGIRLLCVSGGEPFTLGDDLVEVIDRASTGGLATRIVTNGYWATSVEASRKRLGPLVEAGLNEINFSTGPDHAEWVPVENVLRGVAESFKIGLGLALMIEERADSDITYPKLRERAAVFPGLEEALDSRQIKVVVSPWMAFSPDTEQVPQRKENLVNRQNLAYRGPCTSIYSTIVVTPGERLGLCCGLPRESIPDLHAGSLLSSDMKSLLSAHDADLLKMWLYVEGPERILAWAAEKDPTIEWENRFSHNCDACRYLYQNPKVMEVLARHAHEKVDDLTSKFALAAVPHLFEPCEK